MTTLTPKRVANIAKHVYSIRENDIIRAQKISGLGIEDIFEVSSGSRFEGTTGPLILKAKSGFGYVAKGTGQHQGEELIAVRGTAATAQDWITDANIGLTARTRWLAGPRGLQ